MQILQKFPISPISIGYMIYEVSSAFYYDKPPNFLSNFWKLKLLFSKKFQAHSSFNIHKTVHRILIKSIRESTRNFLFIKLAGLNWINNILSITLKIYAHLMTTSQLCLDIFFIFFVKIDIFFIFNLIITIGHIILDHILVHLMTFPKPENLDFQNLFLILISDQF